MGNLISFTPKLILQIRAAALLLCLLAVGLAQAQRLGSIATSRGSSWTLDGNAMTNTVAKLTNPANFGGTVAYSVCLGHESGTITSTVLSQYDVFFIGYWSDGTFTTDELQAMSDWVNAGGYLFITADDPSFDQVANHFGYPVTDYSTPPNVPASGQASHPVFVGPFGSLSSYDNFGNYSYFANTSGATVIARDNNARAVLIEKDIGSGKILISGDVDVVSNYTLSAGSGISNNNDRLMANTFHYLLNSFFGAAEINLQGNGQSISAGDITPVTTDHTDFGTTPVGTPVTRTYTIQNTGADPLNIPSGGITITGANASQFTVGGITLPATINGPSGSATFTVTYAASSLGTHTATINITRNDCNENPYNFDITGQAVCPTPDGDGDGFTVCAGDCNDSNSNIYPGRSEIIGNGIDDNCNSLIDEPNYCTPTVTSPCEFMWLTNVSFGSINNTTVCGTGGYSNFTSMSATLAAGSTNTISIKGGGSYNQYSRVFVDWNRDGDFIDAGETVVNSLTTYYSISNSTTFTIPGSASGAYRLRVISDYDGNPLPGSCSTGYGEAEDYTLIVSASCTAPTFTACPTAPVTASTASGLCNAAVTYTVTATGSPAPTMTYAFTGATTGSGSGTGSGATFNKGNTTVTVTATNPCTPPATCTFTVTVNDNELPTITCPSNITVNNTPGACSAVVNFSSPSFSDNCTTSKNVLIIWDTNNATLNTLKNDIQAAGHTVSLSSVPEYQYNGTNPSLTGFDVIIHLNGDSPAWYTDMPIAGQNALVDFVFNQNKTFIACEWNAYERATYGYLANFAPLILLNYSGFNYSVQTYTTVPGQSGHPLLAGLPASFVLPYSGANIGTAKVYPTDPSVVLMTSANGAAVVLRQLSTGGRIVNFQHSGNEGGNNALVNANVRKLFVNSVGPSLTLTQTTGLASGATFPKGQTVNTFVVTDASNNTNSCQQTVTVIDNQAPTLTCPANTTVINTNSGAACQITIPNYVTSISPTDNCTASGSIVEAQSIPTGAYSVSGDGATVTVNYTATDDATTPNTKTCTVTITVNDNIAPTLTCPANTTVINTNSGAACQITIPNYVTSLSPTDNCTASGSITEAQSIPAGAYSVSGDGATVTVNYTATDGASPANTTTCTVVITVNDDDAPSITCPAPISMPTDPGQCNAVVNYTVSGDDNCSGFTITRTNGLASGSTFPIGSSTINWQITDTGGNSTACSFSVTVNDNEAPALGCPGNQTITTSSNGTGDCTGGYAFGDPLSDNCTGATWNASFSGNTNGNPTALTGVADGTGSGTVTYQKGTTTVTLSATDAASNAATTCYFTVTVNDNEMPVLTCPGTQIINSASGTCAGGYAFGDPLSDNCSGAVWNAAFSGNANGNPTALTGIADGTGSGPVTYQKGTTTVTLSATDAASNAAATCSFTVTVNDNEAPVLTCPGNQTITTSSNGTGDCTGAYTFGAPLLDNCAGGSWTATFSGNVNGNPATLLNIPNGTGSGPVTYQKGTTTVLLSATDASANPALTCSFTVTVNDNEVPLVTCPGNMTLNTNAGGSCQVTIPDYVALLAPTDNCTPPAGIIESQNIPAGPFNVSGDGAVLTLTYSAADGNHALNVTTCVILLTINDDDAPVVNCPANTTVFTNPESGCQITVPNYVALLNPSDNCVAAGSIIESQSVAAGPLNTAGHGSTVTVVYVASDGALPANTVSCTVVLTVSDNKPPVMTCPGSVTLNNDANQCGAVVNYVLPTATDNCQMMGLDHLSGGLSGSFFPVGSTAVTWMATDAANNTETCSFNITVADVQMPSIACPTQQTRNTDPNICTALTTYTNPTVSDNCTGVAPSVSYQFSGASTTAGYQAGTGSGSAFNKGITTVTLRATDQNNLTQTCTFRVIVLDAQAPTFTLCPGNQSVNTTSTGCSSAAVNYATPAATDNCAPAPTVTRTSGPASGSSFPIGTTAIVWRAADGAGRITQCSFTVTVTDNTPPVITCPPAVTATGSGSPCAGVIAYPNPTASDNCALQSVFLQSGLLSGSNFQAGTTVNVWRATDTRGATATCSVSVTVTCSGNRPGNVSERTMTTHKTLSRGWDFTLAPNPADGIVWIVLQEDQDGHPMTTAPTHLLVYDAQGRLHTQQTLQEGDQTLRLETGQWPAGMYWVAMRRAEGIVSRKLIVAHQE